MNGLLAIVALLAIAAIAWLVFVRDRVKAPQIVSPGSSRDRLLRLAAEKAMRRGDYAEAERQYRAALRYHPSRAELHKGRAMALLALGRRKEAWSVYASSVQAKLDQGWIKLGGADTLAWYADLEWEFGAPENAERAARSAFPSLPTGPWLSGRRLLGLAHLWAAGRSTSPLALAHVRRAVRLDPNSVTVQLAAAQSLGDGDANANVARATRLAERGSGVDWMALAEYYGDHKEKEKMAAAVERAFGQVSPSNARAWLGTHILAERMKDKRHAAQALENARRSVRSDDADTLFELARRYEWTKDSAKAAPLADAAKRVIPPQSAHRYGNLAIILLRAGRKDEARTMLQEAIPYADGSDHVYFDWVLAPLEGRKPRPFGAGAGSSSTSKPYAPYGFY